MFLKNAASYLPNQIIPNSYFELLNGLSDQWIAERTGIKERRKAEEGENTNTMAIEAVKNYIAKTGDGLKDVDLIVGASYTPHDTIVTLAHTVQAYLQVQDIPVVYISSACSSFLNALEIVEGYFQLKKSKKALVVLSEHNTAYNDEKNIKSGHLWGDGAAAVVATNEEEKDGALHVKQIITAGGGDIGKSLEGVYLRPLNGGLTMPNGKDVFINACNYMAGMTKRILNENSFTLDDLAYIIPHQANFRITKNIIDNLKLPLNKALSNIQHLGNTGCSGAAIALSDNWSRFKNGDKIVVTVFGGGYSYGSMLLIR
ncbi:MAG TPA: 3-oxoacyl-ACP synthase III family protein [Cyclobacteriaceae bacterium]